MSSGQMWAPLEAGSSQVLETGFRLGCGTPSLPHPPTHLPVGGSDGLAMPDPQAQQRLQALPGVLVADSSRSPLLAQIRLVHGGPSVILPLDKSGQSLLEGGRGLVGHARARSPPLEWARTEAFPISPGLSLIWGGLGRMGREGGNVVTALERPVHQARASGVSLGPGSGRGGREGLPPPSSPSAGSGCSPSGRSGRSSPSPAPGLAPAAPAARSAGPSGCKARTWPPGGSGQSGEGKGRGRRE